MTGFFFRSLSVFYRFQSRGLECQFSHSRGLPSHETESVRNTEVVVRIYESCSCQVTMQMHRPAVSTVSFVQPISIKQFINLHILFRRSLFQFEASTAFILFALLSSSISLLHYAISLLASSNFAAVLCYFAAVLCYFAVVLFYFAAAIYYFAAALFNIDSEILLSRCTSSISMKLCSLAAPRLFR